MKFLLLTVLLLPSCAIVRWAVGESSHANRASTPTTVSESTNKSLWLGLSADDLILHPVDSPTGLKWDGGHYIY